MFLRSCKTMFWTYRSGGKEKWMRPRPQRRQLGQWQSLGVRLLGFRRVGSGRADSRELASRFLCQCIEGLEAFSARSVRVLPCGKVLYAGLFAGVIHGALAGKAAFNVIHVLE